MTTRTTQVMENNLLTTSNSTIEIHTTPANSISIADVRCVNTGTIDVSISIFISSSATAATKDTIEHKYTLSPSEKLNSLCHRIGANKVISIWSDSSTVACRYAAICDITV